MYTEFATHAKLSELVSDARPVLVWQSDGRKILWANAAGAKLFGANRLDDLSRRKFSDRDLVTREVARCASGKVSAGVNLMRFVVGGATKSLPCYLEAINWGDRQMIVLVTGLVADSGIGETPHERRVAYDVLLPETLPSPIQEDENSSFEPNLNSESCPDATSQQHVEGMGMPQSHKQEPELCDEDEAGGQADDPPSFAFIRHEKPSRFAWQMDPQNCFTSITPGFEEIVGPVSGSVLEENWDSLASRLSLDLDGRVSAALELRQTWSDIELLWPVDDADLVVPVVLSALPIFGQEGEFGGFRGFAVCRSNDAATKESNLSANTVSLSDEELPADDFGDEAKENLPEEEDLIGEGELADVDAGFEEQETETELTEEMPVQEVAQSNIVPLHTPQIEIRAEVNPEVADQDESRTLNSKDRQVFDKIASIVGEAFERDQEDSYEPEADGEDDLETVKSEREISAKSDSEADLCNETEIEQVSVDHVESLIQLERDNALARIEELEAVLDTATDGIILIAQDGQILTANRGAEALFESDKGEMIDRSILDFLAPESHRAALDYLDGLSRHGVASVLNDGREVIGQNKTGGLIPLFMTLGRVGSQEPRKFCLVLRDIAPWKRAEEDLTNAKHHAEQASTQKSDFLATISHEVRTPLNAIIGFSEVMMEERFGEVGNNRYREYLNDIHSSGMFIMSLINDLLDLSKIEAGKLDLSFEEVGLKAVLRECAALLQPEANRERVIIRTSLPEDVPNVVADARSVRQIVLNLVANAIKYNRPGGQVILSSSFEANGEVALRVRDTGLGMSAEDIELALEPFRQLNAANGALGTGLGLPLTKALAEANGAKFSIQSVVEQGTMIEICFPMLRVLAE